MAVNLKPKKLLIATGFVNMAMILTATRRGGQIYNDEYVKQAITFVPGDFDNSSIAHVDPNDMGTLITRLTDFASWFDNGTAAAAGPQTADILLKVLSGMPLSIPQTPLF